MLHSKRDVIGLSVAANFMQNEEEKAQLRMEQNQEQCGWWNMPKLPEHQKQKAFGCGYDDNIMEDFIPYAPLYIGNIRKPRCSSSSSSSTSSSCNSRWSSDSPTPEYLCDRDDKRPAKQHQVTHKVERSRRRAVSVPKKQVHKNRPLSRCQNVKKHSKHKPKYDYESCNLPASRISTAGHYNSGCATCAPGLIKSHRFDRSGTPALPVGSHSLVGMDGNYQENFGQIRPGPLGGNLYTEDDLLRKFCRRDPQPYNYVN